MSEIFEFCMNETDQFCKEIQIVITTTARTAKIRPISSKKPTKSRSNFRERIAGSADFIDINMGTPTINTP